MFSVSSEIIIEKMATPDIADLVFNKSVNDGPWESYKISPASRIVKPHNVHDYDGLIDNPEGFIKKQSGSTATIGSNSSITLDFGFNTCGQIMIEIEEGEGQLHLSFAESHLFINKETSDRSMDFFIEDGVETVEVSGCASYKTSWERQRGGFKYLTLSTKDIKSPIKIKSVETYMTNMPSLGENLRNYSGFFYSNDDFLNKIWYVCAYTVQLSTIPSNSARRHDIVMPSTGWSNNETGCTGDEFLTDGARRDRSIWSGDRSITVPAEACCFNSASIKNSTDWIMDEQLKSGQFPYACRPIATYGSDSYHLWSLVSVYNTFALSGNLQDWYISHWPKWKKAIEYSWKKVDEIGLLKVDFGLDWGRNVLQGHALSVNCILYHVLKLGAEIASTLINDYETSKSYIERSQKIKKAIHENLWDESAGLFKDHIKSDIHPQDGNSLAIVFDIAQKDQFSRISSGLKARWTKFGAPSPESPGMHSPFISSFELLAHATSDKVQSSLDLIRLMWGYIWNAPYGVKSSLIEGYYQDGSCKYPFQLYDPSYISHSHPWSCGPMILLTNHVLGLSFDPYDHSKWYMKPKFGDLKFAVGAIKSQSKGTITAGWETTDGKLTIYIDPPVNSKGYIQDIDAQDLGISGPLSVEVNGSPVEVSKDGAKYSLKNPIKTEDLNQQIKIEFHF